MGKSITKTIEVQVDEYVDADVTLRFDEIKSFFDECSNEEKAELCQILGLRTYSTFVGDTLIDQMKMELLHEAASKYSLEELEYRLK